MKKRYLMIAGLALTALLGFTACKADPEDPKKEPSIVEPIETFEVVFDSNGGTSVLSQWVSKDNKVAEPSEPMKENYIFAGWYKDKECKEQFDFSSKVTKKMTLYAKWEEIGELYFLSFNTNGHGKHPNTVEVNKINTLPEITDEGYTFIGWYYDKELTKKVNIGDTVTENKTVYAKWEVKKFTVHFNSNGGTEIASQTIEYGKHCPRPSNPTKENYIFAGWYKDQNFTLPCDFINGIIISEVTCYAKWIPQASEGDTLTVEFNSKLGSKVEAITGIVPGSTIKEPTAPTRKGYTFAGWYKNIDGTLTIPFDFEHDVVTENMILLAKWTPNVITVTLRDSVTDEIIDRIDGSYEQFLSIPSTPTEKENYRFVGWSIQKTSFVEFNFASLLTTDMTLYAYYEAVSPNQTFEVQFISVGTTVYLAVNVKLNEKVNAPTTNPTRSGYTFGGWSTSATSYTPFDFANKKITSDTTIYAYWIKNDEPIEEKYTITFYSSNGVVFKTETVLKNEQTMEPTPAPKKDGYTFEGWYTDLDYSTKYNFSSPVTKDLKLYAKWEEAATQEDVVTPFDFAKFNTEASSHLTSGKTNIDITIDKFTVGKGVKSEATLLNTQGKAISFTLNGTITNSIKLVGTGASTSSDTIVKLLKKNGSSYVEVKTLGTVANGVALNAIETNLEAGAYQITTSVSFKITEFVLTESSKPVAPTSFTVSFDTLGGSVVAAKEVESGSVLQEPTAPTKDGYEFKGWFTDQAYTTAFNFTTPIKADMTLYAKWEEEVIPPDATTYTVSFVTNCLTTLEDKIVREGRAISEPASLTKEDHKFGGWFTDAECKNAYNFASPVTSNLTLYAKWIEVVTYTVTFNINGYGDQPAALTKVTELPELPKLISSERSFGGWYYDSSCTDKAFAGDVLESNVTLYAKWNDKSIVEVITAEGHLETAYLEWKELDGSKDYNVYYKKSTETDGKYVALDKMLIREYPNKYRADVLGLAAGKYTLKVVPVVGSDEDGTAAAIEDVIVLAQDRSGFAFSKSSPLKTGSGAYNEDGTLRAGAQVIYVTAKNAKTVTAQITNGGTTTTISGFQSILDAKQKKGNTDILDFRIIGEIKKSDLDHITSSSEGIQIKGAANYQDMSITIEGVGEDATFNGFGFLIRNCGNVEMKNFGIVNFMDDGISVDTNNCNLWIHNVDFFYGSVGGDADQAKGDGSLDIKGHSRYITASYNHFWDSGKCNLMGMKSESTEDYITYHHNWYDHSDSRHPRIRTCSVHVYNNYFDGNSKYGVGVTMGASAFVENNYFRNCHNPMLSSKQGTDALGDGTFSGENGGIIKAYGNYIEGGNPTIYYSQNNTSFDAYLASSRDEIVPNTVQTLSGGTTYNNFDTASDFYTYTVDTAETAKTNVMKYAGRINNGDLQFVFDNAKEDTNYAVIPELKQMVVSYHTTLVRVLGEK